MVWYSTSIMSTQPTANIESELPAPWSSYTFPEISTVTPGFTSRLWSQDSQPQYWSKYQVWEWLQQMLDMNQIDANSIPFQNFDVDGHQLCSMTFQDFTRAAGTVGPILYQSLNELKWSGQYPGADCLSVDVIKSEPNEFPSPFPESSIYPEDIYAYSQSIEPGTSPSHSNPAMRPVPHDDSLPVPPEKWILDETNEDAAMHQLGTYSDIDPDLETCISDTKKSHSRSQQVKKHNPRGTHLWEFIRDILLNPERNQGLIKWEDRTDGVFRFLKSEAVAQLWGKKKNNSSMTYEKLSRAMRYYYKREILERVDGRRLVYKFGRNARGWRESEK
ncbi:hypothetical protein UPYG_G00266550 [Umbra pygmaea]|uniref:ETS homologous factor n=1 Tax=Umbra pygmaea TaxID=75934 RepID=A0ABD0WVV0_UMBPY